MVNSVFSHKKGLSQNSDAKKRGGVSESYPEKWDKTAIIKLGIIDDSINLLQRTPTLSYQLHGFLIPTMHFSLQIPN